MRHHCPFSHINGRPLASVPQAHIAVTCWPSAHIGIAFFSGIAFVSTCLVAFVCLCKCLICFACANSTDKAIASSVTAKFFSMVFFKTFPAPSAVPNRFYAAEFADSIGSTIEGSSFSGLLTRVEIGHIRIGSAGNGLIRSPGSGSSLSQRV
jgi:hypothetical protein